MRLWSLHPQYLDAKGLVALWREALLAQAVLRGRTRGYRHHPQLRRFQDQDAPVSAIAAYLRVVEEEARRRGYDFDRKRIARGRPVKPMRVTSGQIGHEWRHLLGKLRSRDPARWRVNLKVNRPRAHPLFRVRRGGICDWEVVR